MPPFPPEQPEQLYIYVPYISGQFSGESNELLATSDKHDVVFNGDMNAPGLMKTRAGNQLVTQLSAVPVLGLFEAIFQGGTHVQIAFVLSGGNTIMVNAQTGAQIGSETWSASATKFECVNFLNKVFIVNGIDVMKTWDGATTFEKSSGNVLNAPVASVITRYGARIWCNDVNNPRRVHRSLTPTASILGEVPGGAINSSNKDFTVANPFNAGSLVVMKNNVQLINGTDFTEQGQGFHMVVAPTMTTDTLAVNYSKTTITLGWNISVEFFDVESSGDYVTALRPGRNVCMVFTNDDVEVRYLTRALMGVLNKKGTLSSRSVLTASNGVTFWFHNDDDGGFGGFYAYQGTTQYAYQVSGGDNAQIISAPIQDVVDAIPDANVDKIVGWQEGSTVVWYIGNTVMSYGTVNYVSMNLKTGGWSTWYMPYVTVVASRYMNSTTSVKSAYIATDQGKILLRSGFGDEGAGIQGFVESKYLSGKDPFVYHQFNKVNIKGVQFAGSKIIQWGSASAEPIEADLQQNYASLDVFDARTGAEGTATKIRITFDDTSRQILKGCRIDYNVCAAIT